MAKHHPTVMRIRWVYLATLIPTLLLGVLLAAPSLALAQDSPSTCEPSGNDNDLLYCVWLVEPRFGGMSVDQSNPDVLRVLLTGNAPTEQAADRALAEVNRLWDREFTSTTVATADYTIGQLKGWFDTVAADFHEKMTGVDLDESANRITVMVADLDADQDTVAEHVAGLGVPAEAVQFEEFQLLPSDPVPAAQSSGGSSVSGQSLTGTLVPMVGGGEIQGSIGRCSLGFGVLFMNLRGNYERGFVTAGHCSTTTTGTEFYVPGNSGSPYGISVRNTLPNGVDAQYVRKTESGADLGIGLIARPSQENTGGQVYLDLDARDPYFRIIGTANPIMGQALHKVGRTTGWTSGVVLQTCTDVTYFHYPTSRCVGLSRLDSAGGDSGGPVFSIDQNGSAKMVGIHEGSDTQGTAFFVRMDRALHELFYNRGVTDVLVTTDLPPVGTDIAITSSPLHDGRYQPSEIVEITYTVSEAVTLYPGLEPTVTIAAPDGTYPRAHYDGERSAAAGEDKLVFTWQVPSGMDGGIWVGPGPPNNHLSIGDLQGNPLVDSKVGVGVIAQVGLIGGYPKMKWGGFANEPLGGGRFRPGEEILVTTRWDRPVRVDPDNPPYVHIAMYPNPGTARANYDAGRSAVRGLHYLIFTYVVQAGDHDTNGLWVGDYDGGGSSLQNPGGITDYSGNTASDYWPTDDKEWGVKVRSGNPYAARVDFTNEPMNGMRFQPGEVIEVTALFDRPVKVDENNPPRVNVFLSGSGSNGWAYYDAARTRAANDYFLTEDAGLMRLAFTYAVQDGDQADDGIQVTGMGLLNYGSITDYSGRAVANRNLPGARGHNVGDSGPPSITNVEFTSRPLYGGKYQPGEVTEITLTADEPVRVDGGSPPFVLMRVTNEYPKATYDATRSAAAGSNKLVFTWTVQRGFEDDDGFLIAPDYFRNAGGVHDWSGNPINVTLPGYWGDDPRHKVGDLGAPVITDVSATSVPASDNTYSSGETIEITLTASEPLTVPNGQEPRLVVEVGSQYPTFRYDRARSQAAGGNKLVFTWTVGHGYQDDDGILGLPDSLRDAGSVVDGSGNVLAANLHQYRFFGGHRVDAGANPGRPAQLTATAGNGKVTLSWRDPGNRYITHYRYRQSTDGGATWEFLGQSQQGWFDIPGSGPATTSYTVVNLTGGTEYTFEIVAINARNGGGWSEPSRSVRATPN